MAKQADKASLGEVRHSLAHLLAAAVLKKFPDAKLGIGPVIEHGFYYDFLLPRPISPDDLKEFQSDMKKMIGGKLAFTGKKVTATEAKKLFKNQPFKLELIKDFAKEKKDLTVYVTGSAVPKSITHNLPASPKRERGESPTTYFVDLCKGGHVENTSEIPVDGFKLEKIAGAYWKGDEKNPQLQRIYGLAFEGRQELDAYIAMIEEAKKRDHKVLGPQLDLFVFSDLVGAGLPLWTPKGTILRDVLDSYVWELRQQRGYERVDIPHITKKDLYEVSGHWQRFKDELFKITTREGHVFAMKPMNCPHHTQIYKRRKWSYRELPQRYASTTKVYRDEQSGELAGLSRVRAITQDDAHVFCRHSQIVEEAGKIWDIIQEFYGTVGFALRMRLSLHDPKQMEKYLGTPKLWKDAENTLRNIVKEKGAGAEEALGEAAFYGPKIDFMAKDSMGREHQVATIQLDMNLPERFDLSCVNEEGKDERIVMIHAAIMGSIERYLAVLIEHFAGAFPVWLAPVQATVIPISEKFEAYGKKILSALQEKNIRATLNDANETLGKRIREAELQKIPYILVVGEREEQNNSVSVRHYTKGQLGEKSVEEIKELIGREIENKSL